MAPASTTPTKDPPTAPMTDSATPYTRLHITPFDLSLQHVVIPASVLPRARNISYHTIDTFPEKRFGFVDLPTMDADKLKKKLNGAVLKGTKVRVETARPESTPGPTADADGTDTKKEEKEKKKSKSKKRKREAGIIEGVQLEDRKIKRGWTTTEQEMIEEKRKRAKDGRKDGKSGRDEKKDKKKRTTVKSKYTDEPECLFKTKLPSASPARGSEESGEMASTHNKKRKRKSDREVVVHEFEKTTKYPTFLKSNSTKASAEATTFEDGVGWVDSAGNVVEPVKSKRRPEGIPAPDALQPKEVVPMLQRGKDDDDDDETSSSGSSSSAEDDDASSSGTESDSLDERTAIVAPPKGLKVEISGPGSPPAVAKPESARPKSSGSVTSLSIKIPPATPAARKIHPLEALYKRPQGGDSTPDGSSKTRPFSFFDNEDDVEDDDSTAPAGQAPMTPFTKQEFEFRNVRSAAPTPDTAHPSRSFNFWASQGSADDAEPDEEGDVEGLEDVEEEEEEEEEDQDQDQDQAQAQAQDYEDVDMADGVASGEARQAPSSDFQKQFWESRGDLNRAWRKRRKSAAKEKRYRDNRARAERAI